MEYSKSFLRILPQLLLFCLTLITFACSDTPPPASNTSASSDTLSSGISERNRPRNIVAPAPAMQTVRGMYKSGKAGDFFYDCASGQTYRVNLKPQTVDSLYEYACQMTPYDGESAYAVVRARISNNLMDIINVDTLTAKTMFNTCQPYDFWCVGTEPFWGLFISEAEGGFILKQIGDRNGQIFPWSAPKTDGNNWIYESTKPGTREKLKVTVRKEFCSDGMSDRRYNYAVDIKLNQETLHGCAVRSGEKVKQE